MSLAINDNYEYWENNFTKLFYLVKSDPTALDSLGELGNYVDGRAIQMWGLVRLLLDNLGIGIDIDELGYIPLSDFECQLAAMIINNYIKDHRCHYADRKMTLVEV